jgi:hypothetical protein
MSLKIALSTFISDLRIILSYFVDLKLVSNFGTLVKISKHQFIIKSLRYVKVHDLYYFSYVGEILSV